MSSNKQGGFSVVEILLVIIVVGLVGFVGYMFYANQVEQPTSQQTDAPSINSEEDLDKASKTLDQTDPEASSSDDSKQLDSEAADL